MLKTYKVNPWAVTGAFISLIVWLALAAGLVFALAYRYEFWYIFLSCVIFLCTWTIYGSIYPKEVVIDEGTLSLVMPFGNTVVMEYGDVNMTENKNNYIFVVQVDNKTQRKKYIQKKTIPKELEQKILIFQK